MIDLHFQMDFDPSTLISVHASTNISVSSLGCFVRLISFSYPTMSRTLSPDGHGAIHFLFSPLHVPEYPFKYHCSPVVVETTPRTMIIVQY